MEIVTAILLCVVLLLVKILWSGSRKQTKRIPGPSTLEAFKALLNSTSKTGLHTTVTQWAEEYGNILALNLPGQSIVFLNDADIVREVFTSGDHRKLTNDRQGTFATKFVFDNGSIGFLPLGQEHSRFRRLFNSSLRKYGEGVETYECKVRDELDFLIMEVSKHDEVDLEKVLNKSLMNCIHILLLGRRANQKSVSLSAMLEFNEAMKGILRYELDATLTLFPFLRHIPGSFKHICDGVDTAKTNLLKHFIEEVQGSQECSEGFIFNVLKGDNSGQVTDKNLKCFIIDVLNAGYMTTRGALLGALLCLIENQEVQENVYNEIRDKVGSRDITLDDRSHLPYLDATILEVLRYISHTPFSIPHLTRGDIETHGYTIPRGSLLVANLWGIHHDSKVYTEPWMFRPERFLDCNGRLLPKDNPVMTKLLPFGVGKRQCPGANFAMSRLYLYLGSLVQRFHFRPQNGGPATSADPRTFRPGVILHIPDIRCHVTPRDG